MMSINKTKFTLIELLVVIVIVAILVSMLLPSLAKARFMAKHAVCKSQLSQVTGGITLYTVSNDRWYPYGKQPGNMLGMKTSRPSVQYSSQTAALGLYYGTTENKGDWWDEPLFVCPLGKDEVGWYHEDGLDEARKLKSESGDRGVWHSAAGRNFYNMYFDCEFGFSDPMRRLGDTFKINSSGKEEFNIIAADVYKRAYIAHATNRTTGDMTTHIWGGDRNYPWDDAGAAHFSYGPLYFNTTIGETWSNWAFDDGSVKSWRRMANDGSGIVSGRSPAASRTFYMPEKFAIE
jgi:prepilin-type N-terminal cleavage/methylation domain-containing protein